MSTPDVPASTRNEVLRGRRVCENDEKGKGVECDLKVPVLLFFSVHHQPSSNARRRVDATHQRTARHSIQSRITPSPDILSRKEGAMATRKEGAFELNFDLISDPFRAAAEVSTTIRRLQEGREP